MESLEYIRDPALAAWIFLYTVTRCGGSSPPLDFGRNRRLGSADLDRPLHFFRYLVAIGCRLFCSQETGRSEIERSHVRRGQTLTLKILSFCWRVMAVSSTFCSMVDSLVMRCSLVSAEVEWMATGAPRNRKVVSPR